MPEKQLLRVSVPNGFEAAVELTLPIDFDINAKRKYPLLVYSYGGPGKIVINQHYPWRINLRVPALNFVDDFKLKGSQQVDYKWSGVGFGEFLVSNYDIAYASIDGRGTGFQSDDFTFELYKKLGTVEMEVSCINLPILIWQI